MNDELVFRDNGIDIEPETKTISQLFPEFDEPAKAKSPSSKKKPKDAQEDVKAPKNVEMNEFERKVISTLQSTTLSPRAKAPDEFFLTYTDPTVYFSIFLVYLFLIVITNAWNALFAN